MTRAILSAVIALIPSVAECDDPPVKATVSEILTHPEQYHRRRVDVTGYYVCDHAHASDLWPDAATAKNDSPTELSLYIDPTTWDVRLHPKQSKSVLDPWRVTGHRARVIGTFLSSGARPGFSIPPDSPTIVDVTYFRRVR